MAWEAVPDLDTLAAGERVRLRASVRAPYNAATVATLRTLFRTRAEAQGFHVTKVDSAPPLFTAHDNTLAPWPLIVEGVVRDTPDIVQAGLDPRALLALAGVIIVGAAAFGLLSTKLERFVTVVGEQVRHTVHDVLNPGTVILAVLAIYFLTRRR